MLAWYQDVRPLSREEQMDLCLRLCYPWKNWKLANYYMQSSKTMPPGKNMEKMVKILKQQKNWSQFVENIAQTL